MKYNENTNNYASHDYRRERECGKPYYEFECLEVDCRPNSDKTRKNANEICINNSPVINICVNGTEHGGEEPSQFLSSYMEALGREQHVYSNRNIVFDVNSIDSVGDNIELDPTGRIFTINQTGLYHVEWNLNLAHDTTSAVVGIVENGVPASGSASVAGGSFSSGTLINVETVPFTLSLRNYGGELTIKDIYPFEDSAASIRIVRFADGPDA